MSEQNSELKNIIEAALLAAGEPLTIDKILTMFAADSRPTREAVNDALRVLEDDYQERGIELKRIDRGYRFQTREKYSSWIVRLRQERPPRYSRALLETLAIIAYKQPVTRGDIEAIRGVSVSPEIIRTLSEREWIRQVGHRETPGKPALFGTTRRFVEHFNLGSLDELPPLSDLRDLADIGKGLDLAGNESGEAPPNIADELAPSGEFTSVIAGRPDQLDTVPATDEHRNATAPTDNDPAHEMYRRYSEREEI